MARNRALVFDGEIGNAAPRIETIRRRKRRRWADIEACATIPTVVSLGRVGRQFQRGKKSTEKQPRAEFSRYEVGVLALPPQAGSGSERLFHHGGSIDENPDVAARVSDKPA